MRLTPVQIALALITGQELPFIGFGDESSLAERIREGRASCVQLCRCDHGYDLLAWHEALREANCGYWWQNRSGIPAAITHALADPEWQMCVEELQQEEADSA